MPKVRPNVLQAVGYRLAGGANAGKLRPALLVRLQADDTADLFVFGRPADGAPFTTGPAYVVNVPRAQHTGGAGTWTELPERGVEYSPPFPGLAELRQ